MEWKSCDIAPENVILMTKIDDKDGDRNYAKLKRDGAHWLFPDGKMYVYYKPTHFRYLTKEEQETLIKELIDNVVKSAQSLIKNIKFA